MKSSLLPCLREVDENEEGCLQDRAKGCSPTSACDPLRRLHRYLMLFFIPFLSFGTYFCYDCPAALQDVTKRDLRLTETEFLNLYSLYSWPNVILGFVGGFLIDRVFGISLGAIIFSLFVLVGQLITGAGALMNNIGLMYFARFVFGIGGESLFVAQNTYATTWFPSSELDFVFGLQLSLSATASTISINTLQTLYRSIGKTFGIRGYVRLGATLIVSAVTCLYSTGCALILAFFTKRARRIRAAHKAYLAANNSSGRSDVTSDSEQAPRVSLRNIIHFPGGVWLLCVICVSYYVTILPFVGLGLVFFTRRFYLSVEDASVVNSMVYIVSAVTGPLFGAVISFTGCSLHWLLFSVLLTLLCHLCFAFADHTMPPIVIMILMGLAYSILATCLWSMVAYLLPVYKQGTAYGLIQSVQNFGLAVVSLFAGFLVDNKGYLILELFFIMCLGFCLAMVFVMYAWDEKHGHLLNETGRSRRAHQKTESEQTQLETNANETDSLRSQ
ncbi:unnamed protein product [Dicrocoelium dendriticum]|nr:unnamed protein product [Dicrocoelium dendriticum]